MGRCLGAAPNTGSAVVSDNTVLGVTPGSPESLEGHNSVNTSPTGASEESIGIYSKIKCQWNGCLIKTKLGQGRYGRLNPQGPWGLQQRLRH